MKSAKDVLIQESITLPTEIRDKLVKCIQISFQFEDGTMHHVKPNPMVSQILARDALKVQRTRYDNWGFLSEEDTEI